MLDPGVHKPRRNLLICLGVTLVAWAFVAWGVFEMRTTGEESVGSALKIGLGLLPAILGPFMVFNFWRGVKVFAAMRRGEKEIARWTVSAAELAEFATLDDARNAHGGEYLNDWRRPRALPPEGLEIIFAADAVLVGGSYYALVTTGLYRFTRLGVLPEAPCPIEFVTVTTTANRFGFRSSLGVLRLPVARDAGAGAAAVVDHFRRVLTREIVVNPDFYRSRIRFGLIGAPIAFAVAAIGYAIGLNDKGDIDLPTLMFAIGLVSGIALLVLALAATMLSNAQRRRA